MKDLVGKYVIHTKTHCIGKVDKVYAEGEYVDPYGNHVTESVLRFDTGHAFLAESDNFKELSPMEVKLYGVAKQAIVGAVTEIAEYAKAHDMDIDTAADIIAQVLNDQSVALQAVVPTPDTIPSGPPSLPS
jgi:hypothetical protein